LGLEATSHSRGYFLSQAKYASDLLSHVGLIDYKIASTPLEVNVKFSPTYSTPLTDAKLHRQLVGSLVYLTVTRPDVAYALHFVSQFMAALCTTHYPAVLWFLCYIKGSLFKALYLPYNSSLELKAYSYSDWDEDSTDRCSTNGYCFFLDDSLISWCSKKQNVATHSSTKAEYWALTDTALEFL